MSRKFGRLARDFDPKVPHLSAVIASKPQSPPRLSRHWGSRMPADLGMMLNDKLLNKWTQNPSNNDPIKTTHYMRYQMSVPIEFDYARCTCAAFYHALQVWSFNAAGRSSAQMATVSDTDVAELYTLACGYDPGKPGEGPGGKAQQVLRYLLNQGAPIGRRRRNKILGYIEVDPRHVNDVKRAINDCGLVYVGFHVPKYLGPQNRHLPKVWDVDPSNRRILGGHAVVVPGYDEHTLDVISWGRFYTMTWAFFGKYVDEVYAIADQAWIAATGKTPGGLTLKDLETQMHALREVR